MIKKLLGTIALSLVCAVSVAAEGGYKLDHAPDRINEGYERMLRSDVKYRFVIDMARMPTNAT